VLYAHAVTDPKRCDIGLLDEDSMGSGEEACIGTCWRDGAGWKRDAGLQSLFGHVKKTISLCPSWGKFFTPLCPWKGDGQIGCTKGKENR